MIRALRDWRLYVFGGLFLFNLFYVIALAVPGHFPTGTIVTLKKGSGLSELAEDLERNHVVKSALWFRAAVITLGGETGVQAGDYYLRKPQNALTLAWRMVHGSHDLTLVKITVPEGYTVSQISSLFDERFVVFNKDAFESIAPEGYMFPDTYFVQVNVTAGGAIDIFTGNFAKKVLPLDKEIEATGHTLNEILTMASIIEAEVKTPEDRAIVSGILWKRLKLGMALQVDPDPKTYVEPGLPEKPLNNPGLVAINAAIKPKDSPYLYFLSGKDGKTYYAKTLEEHILNIQKHL